MSSRWSDIGNAAPLFCQNNVTMVAQIKNVLKIVCESFLALVWWGPISITMYYWITMIEIRENHVCICWQDFGLSHVLSAILHLFGYRCPIVVLLCMIYCFLMASLSMCIRLHPTSNFQLLWINIDTVLNI